MCCCRYHLIYSRVPLAQSGRPSEESKEEETPEEAGLAIAIMEHFEDIVERVIEKANDRAKWAKEASALEVSSNRVALYRFMGEAVNLMSKFARTRAGAGGLETVFKVLTSVEKETQGLPALMSAGATDSGAGADGDEAAEVEETAGPP
jgi:hypothetical protein